jgi:hypothetical protein
LRVHGWTRHSESRPYWSERHGRGPTLREQRRLLLAKLTVAVAALIALEGELVEPIHERA